MATLLDLFKSQKNELYGGISGKTYIESRGVLNPPRVAALATSSPNQLGDLIGNQVGGILLGSANRPSDTIFRNQSAISKPVSLGKTQEGLKTATDANTSYYVKQSPAPASLLASYKQGATTIGGMAINTAINGITKGGLKTLSENLKQKTNDTQSYGVKYLNGKSETKKFSEFYRDKNGQLVNRTNDEGVNWDAGQSELQTKYTLTQKELDDSKYQNHAIVIFELIPNKDNDKIEKVPFVGTITGITEDISTEWDSFKYIGSPFNIYRYKGVERTLQFDLKLYYTTSKERDIMIRKINYLKELAFPDKNIKTITVADGTNSQYAMAPNLVKVSIGELYKGISVIIDNLSFTIDDNTSWSKYDDGDKSIIKTPYPALNDNASAHIQKIEEGFGEMNKYTNFMYPSVIDVSISMKIIERHGITTPVGTANTKVNTKTYRYNFDGR
jgi:hypothetical protein